jgi:hypothetical protein
MSLLKVGVSVASLMLVLFMGMFLIVFYDQAIDEFLITPLGNISQTIGQESGLGIGYNETLVSLGTTYENRFIPFDIFFSVLFLIVVVAISRASINAKKQGVFSFFGYIFLGSMLFLLSMFFIAQFTDYFIINIYIPLFNDTVIDTPLMFFFFENVKWIAFVLFLWVGLLNQIDFKIVRGKVSDLFEGGLQR